MTYIPDRHPDYEAHLERLAERRAEARTESDPAPVGHTDGGFDRDFHHPRDLAPRSPW